MAAARKNIVFDWNSTLLDDFPIIHDCMNHIMRHVGRPEMTIEHFRDCYEIPFEQLYVNLGFTPDEARHMMVIERDIFHDYYEPKAVAAPLRDGAMDILNATRAGGVGAYILSNHIVDPIKVQLKRLGIEHFFDEVLAYATRETQFKDMSKGKRLSIYMHENGIDPKHGLIVGDSVEEIEIGRAEGMVTVAITGGGAVEHKLRKEKPDYVIHSLHELKPILRERGFVA